MRSVGVGVGVDEGEGEVEIESVQPASTGAVGSRCTSRGAPLLLSLLLQLTAHPSLCSHHCVVTGNVQQAAVDGS